MMPTLFNEGRAADSAGYLLHLAREAIHPGRLEGLLYLAERATLKETGFPLTGDYLLSTPEGMVLERVHKQWRKFQNAASSPSWIPGLFEGTVRLGVTVDDPNSVFVNLSRNDRQRLASLWKEYGELHLSQLREVTTMRCNEWLGPGVTKRVPYENVFPHLGYTASQVVALTTRIEARRNLNAAFSR